MSVGTLENLWIGRETDNWRGKERGRGKLWKTDASIFPFSIGRPIKMSWMFRFFSKNAAFFSLSFSKRQSLEHSPTPGTINVRNETRSPPQSALKRDQKRGGEFFIKIRETPLCGRINCTHGNSRESRGNALIKRDSNKKFLSSPTQSKFACNMCGNKFYSSMFFLPAEINSVRRLLRFHIDHSMIDSTTIYNSKGFTLERTNELNVNSILKRLGLETWSSVNRIPRLVPPPSPRLFDARGNAVRSLARHFREKLLERSKYALISRKIFHSNDSITFFTLSRLSTVITAIYYHRDIIVKRVARYFKYHTLVERGRIREKFKAVICGNTPPRGFLHSLRPRANFLDCFCHRQHR